MLKAVVAGLMGATALTVGASAADIYGSGPGGYKDGPVFAPNIWTGFYIGTHDGAVAGSTKAKDPFGSSIYGDDVRTTGALSGAQVGYNYQFGRIVAGVEADASWTDVEGTNTCFAFSGFVVSSNCRVKVDGIGTVAARLGTTIGEEGRTLLYLKAGGAWEEVRFSGQVNGGIGGPGIRTSVSDTKGGWTVGAGVERAITPHWSIKAEYNYLNFGDTSYTTPALVVLTPGGLLFGGPGARTTFSDDLHVFKVGVNYKFNGDGRGPWDELFSGNLFSGGYSGSLKDGAAYVSATEIEVGTRYAGGWGRFQKDLGIIGLGTKSLASRLTYDDLTTNSGELFARVDFKNNLVIKGYGGLGGSTSGKLNDEDWALPFGPNFVGYSNTRSDVSTNLAYGTIDVGYDVMRNEDYKVAPFVGYTVFYEKMKASGCAQIANPFSDCVPALPTSVLGITEEDTWQGLRVGSSIQANLTPRITLNAEAAYLPYVSFTGTDNHVLRALVSPEKGYGQGAQFEASLSYRVTEHWNVGVGGRYTTMWTDNGNTNFGGTGIFVPQRFAVEQASGFAQLSYKFGQTYEPLK